MKTGKLKKDGLTGNDVMKTRCKSPTSIMTFLMIMFIFAGATYSRNTVWQTDQKLWTDVANKSPGKGRAYMNLGSALCGDKEYTRAIEMLSHAISLNYESSTVYYDLGTALEKTGQKTTALLAYEKAISIQPSNYQALNNSGVLYGEAGEYDTALERLNRAIAANPVYAVAYNNRGFTYSEIGQTDEAFKDFTKAIELDPKNEKDVMVEALVDRGKIYIKNGENGLAMSDFQEACNFKNEDACNILFHLKTEEDREK